MTKNILSDFCEFINGGAWSESEYTESGIPVLKVSNIRKDTFLIDSLSYLSENGAKKYSKNILRTFDVVIATVGSHPNLVESAAGRSAIIPTNLSNYLLNQNAVCIRSKNEKILNQRYLGYLTKSKAFINYIQNRGKGAANQMRIPISDIKKFPIKLPTISIQNKIASILSNYNDLLENNLNRINLIENYAKITYEEWFYRFKYPGYQDDDFDDKVEIPKGWYKKPITEFLSFKQDKTKAKKFIGSKIYLATADVDGVNITSQGESITWDNKPSRAQISPTNNTVWFARMSNTFKILCFNNRNKYLQDNIMLSSGFAGFKAKNEYCLPFLYFTINSDFFNELKNIYATGATQVSLNNESLKYIKMVEPNLNIIESFGRIILPLLEEISVLVNQNQYLIEARDILLPRLLSGMIDIEKIELEV